MKRKAIFFSIGVITTLLMLVSGCAGINPTGNLDASGGSLGRLVVKITDAPNVALDRVMLTITGLQVHKAVADNEQEQEQEQNNGETQSQEVNQNQNENKGGWEEIELIGADEDGKLTFNLLDYRDGLQKMAAIANLEPGKYTQIRMEVETVELDLAGGDTTTIPATLPSGSLKFIQPFDLVAGQTTELLFDIDAMKSVHQNGKDNYMFKPVIKLDVTSQPVESGAIVINTTGLDDAIIGTPYSEAIQVEGGKAPWIWSWEANDDSSLPPGLNLDTATGMIYGTPTEIGTCSFTITVVDSNDAFPKNQASQSLTLRVADILQITTAATLTDGTAGSSYSAPLEAVGGIGPYTWSLVEPSTLPDGLALTSDSISGTSITASAGIDQFTIMVTDSSNPVQEATQIFSITIN
jgi:hypothetical protein